MIKSITLNKTNKAHFTNKLYHNRKNDITFKFDENKINIITGRNGSGKSVLLKIMKTLCGIDRDNTYPTMPQPFDLSSLFSDNNEYKTIPKLISERIRNKDYPKSSIDWDGAIVYYFTPDSFNPHDMWNLLDNPNKQYIQSKDDLFSGIEILDKFMSNKSKGESSVQILTKLYNLDDEYDKPLTKHQVNDSWLKANQTFHDWLNSYPKEKGKPTLLIDELDEHLDIDNQNNYWLYIKHLMKKWQVIVVSHSVFAFKQEDANYINLNPEYFNKVRKLF